MLHHRLALLLIVGILVSAPLVGQQTRSATAMPPISIASLADLPEPPRIGRTPYHHEERQAASAMPRSGFIIPAPKTFSVFRAAPPVATGFASASSGSTVPADASGDVSPSYVVGVFNRGLYAQGRSGAVVADVSLEKFWADPSRPVGLHFDPRIAYDRHARRWVFVTLWDVGYKKSTLLIAVSQTEDPAGGWNRYGIRIDPTDMNWGDFTRLALTRDYAIVMMSMDGNRFGSDILMIPKTDLYTSPEKLEVTQLNMWQGYAAVPVSSDDSTSINYIVTHGETSIDIYSVTPAGLSLLKKVTAPFESAGYDGRSEAPQLGSALVLDTGFPYVQSAVYRDGNIWGVRTLLVWDASPFGGHLRSALGWWRCRPDGSQLRGGTIDDPARAKHFAFASIAVNRVGAAIIAYSVFHPTRYPSAEFTYIDTSGAPSSEGLLNEGKASIPFYRWGDYTATVVDPVNDMDFWTLQIYGDNALGEFKKWSAWWSNVDAPDPRRRAARH